MQLKLQLAPRFEGMRAARFLQDVLAFSPLQCKKIRLYGILTVDGKLQRMKDPLPSHGLLELQDPDVVQGLRPELLSSGDPYRIYADEWFVVSHKPAGMLSHPNFHDPNPAMTEVLADPPLRPVQRLDRDTSGLMLLAQHAHAQYRFSQMNLIRRYLAFVHGLPSEDHGVIDKPIARNPGSGIERRIDPNGKEARSHWRCLKRWPQAGISLLELELETGRTHQLRLHCLSEGWPLLGETLYTADRKDLGLFQEDIVLNSDITLGRQALHAYHLGLIHPDPLDPRPMVFRAALPEDLKELLTRLSET